MTRDLAVPGGADIQLTWSASSPMWALLDRIVVTVAPVTLGSDRLTLTDVERLGQFAQLSYDVG